MSARVFVVDLAAGEAREPREGDVTPGDDGDTVARWPDGQWALVRAGTEADAIEIGRRHPAGEREAGTLGLLLLARRGGGHGISAAVAGSAAVLHFGLEAS